MVSDIYGVLQCMTYYVFSPLRPPRFRFLTPTCFSFGSLSSGSKVLLHFTRHQPACSVQVGCSCYCRVYVSRGHGVASSAFFCGHACGCGHTSVRVCGARQRSSRALSTETRSSQSYIPMIHDTTHPQAPFSSRTVSPPGGRSVLISAPPPICGVAIGGSRAGQNQSHTISTHPCTLARTSQPTTQFSTAPPAPPPGPRC